MKKIFVGIILLVILLSMGGCATNTENEIKELIKDVPIPIRYSGLTGNQLNADYTDIKVYKVSSGWNYDPITGGNIASYYAKLHYGGFWTFDNTGYYAELICNGKIYFTFEWIKRNTDKLYWR